MKHSLKKKTRLDLQRSRQSPVEHRPLRTTQAAPPSAPPAAAPSWSSPPCSATPATPRQKQPHTGNRGSVTRGSLHNSSKLHQICHNAHKYFLNNAATPIFFRPVENYFWDDFTNIKKSHTWTKSIPTGACLAKLSRRRAIFFTPLRPKHLLNDIKNLFSHIL